MKLESISYNEGFDGRVFLTKLEWQTYRKRKPVRYIKKKKPAQCEICNKPPTKENPLQNSHIIGFGIGIIYLGLTPEYVDNDKNIVSAHRKKCNQRAELNLRESCKKLRSHGIVGLPVYLPKFVHEIWHKEK